jgi:hypothetical protein
MVKELEGNVDFGIKYIRVENLFLDPDNPRLAKPGRKATDLELMKELYDRYDLKDVLLSLAQHGYFSEEPLIAVPKDHKDVNKATKFTVVEGNRRLAALKLLLFEDARKYAGAKNIPLPTNDEITKRLAIVPVKTYNSRKEIVPYLGVRHITGVKDWDSQSKAKYIHSLVQEGYKINEITKMVASRSDIVARSLLTLYVLNQANKITDNPWEEEADGFSFSFLYTALEYNGVRQRLGVNVDAFKDPRPNPIPRGHKKDLIYCMEDLYGSPDGTKPPTLTDSRNIKKLAAIYESQDAWDYLRGGATLEQAYRKSGGEQVELIDLLSLASRSLDEADGIISHIKKNPEALRWAKRCLETVERVVKSLSVEN